MLIFVTMNLISVFIHPKRTICDIQNECNIVNRRKLQENEAHIQSKLYTKEARDKDRTIKYETVALVCFDLQNVIALPRANVSTFFCRRKLNMYNLTAHGDSNDNKDCYCAVWTESLAGRAANHIASALICIFERIVTSLTKLKMFFGQTFVFPKIGIQS